MELEDSKLNAIIMELDILHRAVAPEIVEFYGAFFVESCVYYCMEYMDAGSLEQLEHGGVPEPVLARIAHAMVRGLKFLKDELQIMHRGAIIPCYLTNIFHLHSFQMSSQQMCLSIEEAKSDCVTLESRGNWNEAWRRPTSDANLTWR